MVVTHAAVNYGIGLFAAARPGSCNDSRPGLARGTSVEDTGGPLKVPVGKAKRSRMLNVFGRSIDRDVELADDIEAGFNALA
jgi:F0F1-type ATP synthase beta subunit